MRAKLAAMAWLTCVTAAAAQTASVAHKLGPIPPVPAFPPAPAAITPPDLAPPHPTEMPPEVRANLHAAGAVAFSPTGLRVTFGTDSADLNPITKDAITTLARRVGRDPATAMLTTYDVDATAPGTPQDPSAPRRLSLERGLTVRSVLMHAGVASTRIYVHALGARGVEPGLPADRADIRLGLLGHAAPAHQPPSQPTGSGTTQ